MSVLSHFKMWSLCLCRTVSKVHAGKPNTLSCSKPHNNFPLLSRQKEKFPNACWNFLVNSTASLHSEPAAPVKGWENQLQVFEHTLNAFRSNQVATSAETQLDTILFLSFLGLTRPSVSCLTLSPPSRLHLGIISSRKLSTLCPIPWHVTPPFFFLTVSLERTAGNLWMIKNQERDPLL